VSICAILLLKHSFFIFDIIFWRFAFLVIKLLGVGDLPVTNQDIAVEQLN